MAPSETCDLAQDPDLVVGGVFEVDLYDVPFVLSGGVLSDLIDYGHWRGRLHERHRRLIEGEGDREDLPCHPGQVTRLVFPGHGVAILEEGDRSEERRVGKEWRCRWSCLW